MKKMGFLVLSSGVSEGAGYADFYKRNIKCKGLEAGA